MNYTSNDPNHEDTPNDWLNSSMIFARALGQLLNENEGIVIDLKGDMKFMPDFKVKKVIVFNSGKQIIVEEADPKIPEGQMCYITPIGNN